MRTIYAIGDSHCLHAWHKIPGVVAGGMGAMTMHNFGSSRSVVVAHIPEDAVACFCWGEIDCRCHVHVHQPWKETIDTLVKNYLHTIDLNAEVHKRIWIYNVVPPPRREGIITLQENPSFPFVGDNAARLSYVRYMNQKLKESKYPFVDVYDKYADADGFLLIPLSDCHVHISDEKYLMEWVEAHRDD